VPNFIELMEESYNASKCLNAGVMERQQSFGLWGVKKEDFPDQRLDECCEIDITKRIEMHIKEFEPVCVFTHFEGDLNKDHEIVSKCVKVACRTTSKSKVDTIYEFPVLSSSNYNSKVFVPDTYVELGEKHMIAKMKAMDCYKGECYGMRGPDNIVTTAKYLGIDVGYKYAEVFKTYRNRVNLLNNLTE